MKTLIERFEEKVDRSGDCHIWTAARKGKGNKAYGQIGYTPKGGKTLNLIASRLAFKIAYGMFDERLDVLHRCGNPPCVNPEHLYLGDAKQNAKDMVEMGRFKNQNTQKTHCSKGHEFTEENTKIATRKNGKTYRVCRECRKFWAKRANRAHMPSAKS